MSHDDESAPSSHVADQIAGHVADALAAVAALTSMQDLDERGGAIVGKRSALAVMQRSLAGLSPDQRRDVGARLQEARRVVEEAVASRRAELLASARTQRLEADRLELGDVVVQRRPWPLTDGHAGLVSTTQAQLEDVFVAMGYEVADGPQVESDWYNFEALNIPPAHPARGMWDTFYVGLGDPETVVLRTHTSPTQVHLMESAVATGTLPIHAVAPGRCFRRDTPDARHLAVFHQIEGLVVDRGITFADLAGTIETFTRAYFGADIDSRLRPSYFPFTEPSAEFEITCTICRGEGCRTCSHTGWIELGGCGMLDPAVFDSVGIDAEEWSGFAFGFGIDRCAQMKVGLSDMRALIENDVRFLDQFA